MAKSGVSPPVQQNFPQAIEGWNACQYCCAENYPAICATSLLTYRNQLVNHGLGRPADNAATKVQVVHVVVNVPM
jgi:hypothetical protein